MIAYEDIKQGIARRIASAFKDAVISDDPYSHVDGASFIVKVVDNDINYYSVDTASRRLFFDVVYFAPVDTPIHVIDNVGQSLAEAFVGQVAIANRYITPTECGIKKVAEDLHLTFYLEFYDEIKIEEHPLMNSLDFEITLK